MTVLGRAMLFQRLSGTTNSVPTASDGCEMEIESPCRDMTTHLEVSVLARSSQRTNVEPIRSIWMLTSRTSAAAGTSFLAIRRRGTGLLQVRIEGCGRRADISIDGARGEVDEDDGDDDNGDENEGTLPFSTPGVEGVRLLELKLLLGRLLLG